MDAIHTPQLLQALADRASDPTWVGLWRAVAFLGTADFFAIAIPLLFALAALRPALILSTGFVLAASVSEVLKHLIDRPRPDPAMFGLPAPLEDPGAFANAAFPSGHVLMAVVLWGLVAARARGRWRFVVRGLCLALIAAIAFSRLALVRHDLLDVAGGLVLGTLLLIPILGFEKRLLPSMSRLPRVERVGMWLAAAIALQLIFGLPVTALVMGVGAGLGVGGLAFAGCRRRTRRPSSACVVARTVLGLAGVAAVRALVPLTEHTSQVLLFAAYACGGLWVGGILPALTGGVFETPDEARELPGAPDPRTNG